MRKWMRERLQRRKKKTPEQGSQPAPPPLQPAYFDAGETPESAPSEVESADVVQAEPEPQAEGVEASSVSDAAEPAPKATSGEARGRGRRRRGGRGRGGR
ncbi:MAG: hypothetical protein WCB05_12165, partial [Candidatus Sulfotelmatobacter sp.]